MRFFAAIDALPSLESMKFPVFSLLTGNFGLFRDEFAADSPLQRRVVQTIGSAWKAFSERDSEFESGFLQRRVTRTPVSGCSPISRPVHATIAANA